MSIAARLMVDVVTAELAPRNDDRGSLALQIGLQALAGDRQAVARLLAVAARPVTALCGSLWLSNAWSSAGWYAQVS